MPKNKMGMKFTIKVNYLDGVIWNILLNKKSIIQIVRN